MKPALPLKETTVLRKTPEELIAHWEAKAKAMKLRLLRRDAAKRDKKIKHYLYLARALARIAESGEADPFTVSAITAVVGDLENMADKRRAEGLPETEGLP